jgi:hypothetical protein
MIGLLAALLTGNIGTLSIQEFTSTREVVSIDSRTDGKVVIATRGGTLIQTEDGWVKRTILNGEVSNEPTLKQEPLTWNGRRIEIKPLELTVDGAQMAIPISTGTHISAAAIYEGALLVAMYGDGVFQTSGADWMRVATPSSEVTSMAEAGGKLWIGTRRNGAFVREGDDWRSVQVAGEIPNHNIQSLFAHGKKLYACTLEDGLLQYENDEWKVVEGLSSKAPRQVIEFGGDLYVRHGTGAIDRISGAVITRGLESGLPRKQATTLATDGNKLFVGQWGGWSEFDGVAWTHRFNVKELKGIQVTALLAAKGAVWVGTQGSGFIRVDADNGIVKTYDERHGLKDDWVTRLSLSGDEVIAGTFAGGLARIAGNRVSSAGPLAIRDISNGYAAGESEVWRVANSSAIKETLPLHLKEIQAICYKDGSLWVGCRTGLYRFCWPTRRGESQ